MSFLIIVVLMLLATPAHPETPQLVNVIDGDTFKVGPYSYRLYGIDAPELSQPYGEEAKKALESMDIRKFEIVGTDKYGRELVIIPNVQETLIKLGYVWVYPQYCKLPECESWKELEDEARTFNEGLWEKSATPPWEYRKSKKSLDIKR